MTPEEYAEATAIRAARAEALAYRDTMRAIVREVAEVTGIPASEITSPLRGKGNTPRARWLAMAMARNRGLTLAQIGEALGRHHTSVLHGIRRHTEASK